MNRVFRIVWSTALSAWVVASELTGKHGKGRGCAASATIDERSSPLRPSQSGWTLRLGVLMGLASLYAAPTLAADKYWDVNGGSAGSGGIGNWDISTPNWNAASDGVAGPFTTWNNTAIDNAVFAGTPGTVTLTSPITVNNLTFTLAGYTLTGGTLTLAGTTPTIAGAATISSVIAGNAGLTKSAGGVLSLTGANTFSGGIIVSGGQLAVSSDAALGAAGNGITMASGTQLNATAALAATRVVTVSSGNVGVFGVGVGSARFTGAGGLLVGSGVTLKNAASDYTGVTSFNTGGTYSFNSIGNLGQASALGAPITQANGQVTVAAGGGLGGTLIYTGSGSTSNRDWVFANTSSGGTALTNAGTGTLNLSGNIVFSGTSATGHNFNANSGNLVLSGIISSPSSIRPVSYSGTAGQSITLGGANTYTGPTNINNIDLYAPVLADSGNASSLGTGASGNITLTNGKLHYTGGGASTNRTYAFDGASTINNDGTGGLSLTAAAGFNAGGTDSITLGGSYSGSNTYAGAIGGTGNVLINGNGNWLLSGANTYAGTTTVTAGTLTAGSANAFGASKGLIVNGGTLDLNDLAITAPSLAGTGGSVDLGSGSLTLSTSSGSTSYAGSIGGTGSLTKLGASTQTLTGANTYTGATTIGGGTLALDFSVAGAPASNIINSASALNLGGGTLSIKGAAGANTQIFNGLNVTAGNNRISATAGAGGLGISLGGINRSGGLVDFAFNTGTTISTTHADGALGGWATVNGTDYAQVSGGIITAFTNYADKDNANTWANGDIVSDEGGNANTPYTGTVNGSVALGGMKVAAAAGSTVNVSTGNTLSVDGSIIVSPTAGAANQTIQGGSLTGGTAGSPLGVLQNAAGNFTISSTIVDNGGATGFVVGGQGTGTVSLNGANTYTGSTTVSGGTLAFNSVANGGAASAIGASTNDPSNLVLENGTLHYTGATASTDRGFTLVNGGPSRTIQVDGTTDLTFSGQVTSPDDAGFTKTGTGTLTLSNGANDFVGPVTVSAGLLSTGTLSNGGLASGIGAGSNASASLVLQNGGGLEYTGATTSTDRGFTLAGGQGHVSVDSAATTLTDSGTIIGAGSLYKDGAGTLVLSGTNTYTGGSTITDGILRAGSATAFSSVGVITVNAGGTLDASTFPISIGGLNGAGNVTMDTGGSLSINGNGTFSGAISGPGGVTIVGHSETFSGCGNSYTGATIIASSTITTDCLANGGQASGVGASSNLPANLQIAGTLAYTGTSVNIDRGIQMNGTAAINVSNAATTLGIGGAITGAGQFQKVGAGTLVLSGTNINTAGTYIIGGTLRAGATNAFGTGYMTLANTAGVLLDLNNFNTSVAYLDGGGTTGGNINLGSATLTVTTGNNSNGAADFAGVMSGTGNLVKNGAALQILSGAVSTYTGTTTIGTLKPDGTTLAVGGTLQVDVLADGGMASSIGASSNAASNLVLNNGTLQYAGAGNSTDRLFTLGPSSALDASGTGAVQFTNTGAVAFSGAANSAQTVTLTGTSAANNSLALQITNNGTGNTSLSKTGIGTWILRNAASTYGGVTTIAGGVLGVDHLTNGGQASSIGASSNAASNLVIGTGGGIGATLRYTGTGDTTDRLFTLSTGSSVIESSGTGAIVFSNTGSAAYAGSGNRTLGLGGTNTGNNTMGGSIIDATSGITTLAKNDAGTWLLTGNNTYTGNTVVNAGLLQIGNGGTTGSIASPTVIVDTAGTLGFDRSDTSTLAGTISGAGSVVQSGSGTTVLTATNIYTGGTTITAGTLQLGNGGTNGSIVGNVADNGTLAFNRSDVYTFGGLVSGTGGVTQLGSGTTVLTGANSYTGATNVQAGTLLIDGNQSAATGATTVQNGAVLGGAGTLGGSVTVMNGGALNPGDAGAAGTLTINGGLTLGATSTLNYQFGQPNVVGGALNDLTVVHGNLNLDGTLNVSATPGGSFGPGLYRIISYDGTLNDQGLALGGSSTGNYQVQTSVANQVNLINTGGLTLNFWDGANGHTNNTVDGGNGVWQNSAGNSNWTSQTGQVNAPYTDGEFSIFMGTPGTVTVDNTLGTVTSSGMQFAVNGYTVTGDPITFVSGQDVVRVGDGTAAGAGMTATITAPLNGAGTLVKEDLGTLIINSINNLTGGTAINGGVLQVMGTTGVGAPGAAVSFDGGTLRTTQSSVFAHPVTINQGGGTFDTQGAGLIINQTIGGAGELTKMGPGTLTLSATNTYAGGTAINGGAIKVSSDANLGNAAGALSFDGGALNNTAAFTSARGVTLGNGGGTFDTTADLTLAGTIGGAGALNKIDAGALVLTADNTYTGGTTIGSGVLQLGDSGTSGSIQGNIANSGTLVFDRSDSVAFTGAISGTGALEQQGTGTTVLSAANSYTGPTAVRAGSLIINGDQSAATGTTSVDSGGTLGGKGIIGGDVTVADGGTLSPGDVGSAPGTLTVKGSVALSDTSNLNVNMGQANVVGGPLNDLVQVNGDLTLDGTLNVSVSSGGTFDPGIYRIIGYTGALTDNGLTIGSVPSPDYFLQTSIAQQVNLVNTNGLAVNFWDGNGARGDGQVQGGDGLWQNAAGNDNWTVIDGSLNAPYQDSSFAIFAGAAGTVTVDASLGAINSNGMQFATDGYRVEGDAIALVGSAPVIRVGDGTTAGADMTATIASVLTGSNGMTKSDLGTLVLAGNNTYTGGTTITGGTLQLGEGGTSGSILGDVADNGTLAFDRSDVQTFGGAISGTGGVTQMGTGTTTLTSANTYTGATTVSGGTLLINGDQTAATGATTVMSGGTLGGSGTIGGDVTVANGGTLSPGNSPGTLTVNGNLTLNAGALVDYQLGQAGTVGGSLNDLTVVHGNLTLDGTLNVTTTPGGTFGAGVYRLFNYDGTLTDNGLAIGSSPSTNVFVQTSLANQVNLVNTDGLTLSFWDGPGHANDGAITGGTGTWRLSDNDYWTDASGALNAPYTNGSFAVFGGTGGTVTVDNTNGQVSASGLQFQADGYRVTGDAIALTGGASTIRVGDGTAAGASMTATIDAALTGASMLVKDDLGTLVLTGANTYSGGTDVHAGTLQVANDGNLGLAAGSLSIDDATLHTTGSFVSTRTVGLGGAATIDTDDGTTLQLSNGIGGTGSLSKAGTGTLTLGGTSTYSGDTTVAAGTLSAAVANAFNASSATTVQSGATLNLGGFAQRTGALTNAGTVNFGQTPGTSLTVQGDYVGQGGTLNFNTALGGDGSATDMLVVTGSTSGNTTIQVTNVGGTGAATTQGIKLIDVQGASNGTFALKGNYVFQGQQAVVAGAYAYRLYQNGVDGTDGDWYLRSALTNPPSDPGNPGNPGNPGGPGSGTGGATPLYQPGVPLYEAYAGILQQANTLDTLFQRTGDRQWADAQATDGMKPGEGVWVRVQGGDQDIKPESSTSGTRYDMSNWKSEVGIDTTLSDNGGGKLVGSASLHSDHYNSDVSSAYGDGRINTRAYGVGAALTWYADNGLYVDGQARWTHLDSDLHSNTLGKAEDDNKATGYAAGVEVGQRFRLSDAWSMVPQAQLSWGKASFDGFNDAFGARVSQQDGNAASARAGTTFDYLSTHQGASGAVVTHFYAIANVYDYFTDAAQVNVSGTDFTTRNERWWGGLGVGGAIDWAGGRYSIYGEVQAQTGLSHFGDSHAVNGSVGFRMRW
ncbi:autotransporter outer membrane beta-barrel domain-containing protein [Dyella kyungheensis]|uniref:Autotransporter outer membrane beta-barrel domain-containing protein n=2 Tax=Dyella kyungheensis TaxID=1242174 RepID=A0ABS2JT35_9GAMM|nr:autotransporter outer membrane beta-barrel domain-containing protein [Dyella kyungheensis]MBM7122182.1 autotransporter outer membrane beta-barrel domain-containing protein [Dyella kyungheensis]